MSTPSDSATVGPWAKQKLEVLRRYLEFYTTVLKKQSWRTLYVDAFAGGGRAVVRTPDQAETYSLFEPDQIDSEQFELVSGSPRVALEIKNPFARYVFIDSSSRRVAELEALRVEFGTTRQIDVLHSDAAAGIAWITSKNIKRSTHRGVVFLDPFGAQLDWITIQALAETRVFEVVINFALNMAIQRMLPNSGIFQAGWRERLDSYFGTPAWYDEVYQEQSGLLGSFEQKRPDYRERLLSMYRQRLREAFGCVSEPKPIRNTKGVILYHLLWAGPHQKGLEGANYILKMGEP